MPTAQLLLFQRVSQDASVYLRLPTSVGSRSPSLAARTYLPRHSGIPGPQCAACLHACVRHGKSGDRQRSLACYIHCFVFESSTAHSCESRGKPAHENLGPTACNVSHVSSAHGAGLDLCRGTASCPEREPGYIPIPGPLDGSSKLRDEFS